MTLETSLSGAFYEPWYLSQNPQAGAAIASGQYQSGLDYYLRKGQFLRSGEAEGNQRTLWNGTSANDIVTGVSPRNTGSGPFVYLIGVAIDSVGEDPSDITVQDWGGGQIDVLIGTAVSDRFFLGGKLAETDELSSFYLGQGDRDYAYIKGFDPTHNDELFLAGSQSDYTFASVDGNTQISRGCDLVAIVEGEFKLIPSFFDRVEGGTALWSVNSEFINTYSRPAFNESYYLESNADAKAAIAAGDYPSGFDHFMQVGIFEDRPALYNGQAGNDRFFYVVGKENYIFTVPVTQFDLTTGTYQTETLGTGESDHAHGSRFGTDYYFLGDGNSDFYVGNGSEDSFLIGDFDPKQDFLLLSNASSNYTIELVENTSQNGTGTYETRNILNANGDLMVRLEDGDTFDLVPYPTQIFGMYALVSSENARLKAFTLQPEPTVNFEFTTIDVPGGTETEIFDISNDGTLIGSYLDENKVRQGFLLKDSNFATFSISDSPTRGFGINSLGQTVGYYQPAVSGFEQYGFLQEADGTVTPIAYPGQTYNYAFRINDAGAIGGYYFEFPDTPEGIFITSFRRDPDGSFTKVLFSQDGEGTVLRGLNDAGTQVGWWLKPNERTQGLIYKESSFTPFDVPSLELTLPQDINNSDYIVGYAAIFEESGRGFMREPDGDIAFFQVPGAVLTEPLGLNDWNQVVGNYTDQNGIVHGFVTNALPYFEVH